jgi:hypothetical protein
VEAQILEIQELELSAAAFSRNENRTGADPAPVVFLRSSRFASGSGGTARKSTVVVMMVMAMMMAIVVTVMMVMPAMMPMMPMMPMPMHLGGL